MGVHEVKDDDRTGFVAALGCGGVAIRRFGGGGGGGAFRNVVGDDWGSAMGGDLITGGGGLIPPRLTFANRDFKSLSPDFSVGGIAGAGDLAEA